jgi:hypothetical protein
LLSGKQSIIEIQRVTIGAHPGERLRRQLVRCSKYLFFVRPAWAYTCGCKSRQELMPRGTDAQLLLRAVREFA